jgi:hypothetical protein
MIPPALRLRLSGWEQKRPAPNAIGALVNPRFCRRKSCRKQMHCPTGHSSPEDLATESKICNFFDSDGWHEGCLAGPAADEGPAAKPYSEVITTYVKH